MLDIDRGPDVDPSAQQFLDVLVAFGMTAFGRIGMRELIDDHEARPSRQSGVEIEFLDQVTAIDRLASRQDLQSFEESGGFCSPMRLDEADHDIHPVTLELTRGRQHGVSLADAWRRAQKNLELAARFRLGCGEKSVRIGSRLAKILGLRHGTAARAYSAEVETGSARRICSRN